MSLTHKEFHLLLESQIEKNYDEMEKQAVQALMMRKAYHTKPKKNLKVNDFFKRPSKHDQDPKQENIEDKKKRLDQQQQWLSRFNFD